MLSRTPSGAVAQQSHLATRRERAQRRLQAQFERSIHVAIDLRSERDAFRVVVVVTALDAIQAGVDPIESDTRVVFQTLEKR